MARWLLISVIYIELIIVSLGTSSVAQGGQELDWAALDWKALDWEALDGWELEGEAFAQARYFPDNPLYIGQHSQNQSLALELSAYRKFSDSFSLEFIPFYRHDFQDDERSHLDIRKAYALWASPTLEIGAGINKVFWGVTEAVHLVDIINQTDAIEAPDQEEKLGQAMVSLSLPLPSGLFDLYLMPNFRERNFPGEDGRLRGALVVDTNNPLYEHKDKDHHIDWAARLKQSLKDGELALSYFEGTARDPNLIMPLGTPSPVLLPYYSQIKQLGLEGQYIKDEWLWKLEAIYRKGQPNLQFEVEDYYAMTGGFEYNIYSIFESSQDLGIILEGIYDQRRDNALTFNEEDIVLGTRWSLNNMHSTEVLGLWIQDADSSAHNFVLELSTEIGNSIAVTVEALIFSEQQRNSDSGRFTADSIGHQMRQDDYLQIEIGYFF